METFVNLYLKTGKKKKKILRDIDAKKVMTYFSLIKRICKNCMAGDFMICLLTQLAHLANKKVFVDHSAPNAAKKIAMFCTAQAAASLPAQK